MARHWRQGILVRSLLTVAGIALLVGVLATLLARQIVGTRLNDEALTRLAELVDTVESTAAVACFAEDEQLAKEVAQGLLRNGELRSVVIRGRDRELARVERTPREDGDRESLLVVRALHSPFKSAETVGEIRLQADRAFIDARIAQTLWLASLLLVSQLLAVVVALAIALIWLVLRPIKATSDRLHHLDAAGGERLPIPVGHEATEIGRLVADINALTAQLVATLEQERRLRRQHEIDQRKYRHLFENAGTGIFVADRDGRLLSSNHAYRELACLSGEKTAESRWLSDARWDAPGELLAMIRACLDGQTDAAPLADDFLLRDRRGEERWLHVMMVPLGDGNVQGTVTDVTKRKREELAARRLAVTDALTGFPNRAGLQRSLAGLDSLSEPFALVMIDLDGFKQINDALGFPAGDALLLAVATRLDEQLGERDRVARIGSDEFALVLAGLQDREAIAGRIDQLASRLRMPYDIRLDDTRHAVEVGVSMGVALFPADGGDAHQLLRAAELALHSARMAGGRGWAFFSPVLQAAAEHRRRLEDDLRAAVGGRELQLVYQPIVELANGKIVGAEALLRWPHPQRGLVPPDVFVPLAEEIGLIGVIGLEVVDAVCRQLAQWRQLGHVLYCSINVSARQIPDALPPALLLERLGHHGLPAESVAIEITESVLMRDVTVARSWIGSLRAAGVCIFLDDFGTGFSSLSYLKRFPLDTLKIDKSFIRDLHADRNDRTLVEAIIAMANSLGLRVVAEGIENVQQLALLQEMRCRYGQGYHIARPLAAEDFSAILARGSVMPGDT
ncbi:EAL domain-containing protein [Sulfuricystis multivorans]|uniref:EAL domain-containing protein n=1 Tax=Sulfuricystis multivorans TaxID=2211108 RepID=UPI000F817944|nr:EAL domain-containing protein [Sulfuricystis multivorans]